MTTQVNLEKNSPITCMGNLIVGNICGDLQNLASCDFVKILNPNGTTMSLRNLSVPSVTMSVRSFDYQTIICNPGTWTPVGNDLTRFQTVFKTNDVDFVKYVTPSGSSNLGFYLVNNGPAACMEVSFSIPELTVTPVNTLTFRWTRMDNTESNPLEFQDVVLKVSGNDTYTSPLSNTQFTKPIGSGEGTYITLAVKSSDLTSVSIGPLNFSVKILR